MATEHNQAKAAHSDAASSVGAKEYEATTADLIRPDKPMRYASLHHHSTYSYLDGFGLPSAHVRRAAELGMPALALTEHGNVSSHVKLQKAAREFGIHPIFGCELYCGKVDEEDRTQRKNHLTVLARDQPGYQNLLRVVSQGWDDYYYEPTVSGEALWEHREGLIVLSGCTGSLLSTSLIGGKNIDKEDASYKLAKETAAKFKRTFGSNYFLEVQMFPELESVRAINQAWESIGRELDIPLVASGDFHYTKPEENELQQVLHSIGRHKSLEDLARDWGYDVSLAPPITDDLVYERLRGTGLSHLAAEQAMLNTLLIANDCNVELPTMERVRFPLPPGYTDTRDVWLKWLRDGWEFRKIDKKIEEHARKFPNMETYAARVKREMEVIESKDFVDYFLIVSDIVKFAKDNGIPVGPARGSAASSLVCYLLRITEVNPMDFPNMMFERFVDHNREDLPDIDLDFDDERRHEVFEYAINKYGRAFTGKIGTFTNFKAKNSLDDVGYVHHIPKKQVEIVKEVLLERSSGDLRSSATIEDTVEQFEEAREVFERFPKLWQATELEGNVKGQSIHAAGLVISTRPLTDVCAVYRRIDKKTGLPKVDEYGNEVEVISMDKYDAEESGLLKIDILGLKNMGMIRIALEYIGMKLQDLYDLPLDDPETIRGFKENDCIGIFQFDGWAMRSVNSTMKPDNFDEIAAVNALARPGPLHSGANDEYVAVKRGQTQPSITHELLDPIVASTLGQIIYQEQILRIVREIGDFTWTHASYIRKIISRKIGEQEFNRQKATFIEGAKKKGMDDETIDAIWGACITAGGYAFNVPHCVSYGMLGYWTMWLKRHHPQAFYAAALRKLPDEKLLSVLRDAARHGIPVYPPDMNESGVSWQPWRDGILAGFDEIPGIGPPTANKIIETRESMLTGFTSWRDLQKAPGVGPKTVESIEEFVNKNDPFEIFTLKRRIDKVKHEIRVGSLRSHRLPYPTHTVEQIPSEKGRNTEVVWIGTIHSRNLRDLYEQNFGRTGEALDISTVKQPELAEWVIMYGEDDTDQMSITCPRYIYPKYREMIWNIQLDHDLVLVRGLKYGVLSRRAIHVIDMWVIDPDD
jgi:DNA polymerase-3 subunit alpha